MSNEKKTLNDEELKTVSGGKMAPGTTIYGADAWISDGEWFQKKFEPDFAYNVACKCEYGLGSFIANRYWYRNGEVWNNGTCSFKDSDYFTVIDDPIIIHNEYTSNKPF